MGPLPNPQTCECVRVTWICRIRIAFRKDGVIHLRFRIAAHSMPKHVHLVGLKEVSPTCARLLGRARARAHLVIWDLVRNGLHRRQRNLPSRCFDARWLPPATALVGRCAAAMQAVIWPGVGGDGRSRGRCSDYPHHASIVNFSALCRAATENLSLCQFTTASPTITATTTRQR